MNRDTISGPLGRQIHQLLESDTQDPVALVRAIGEDPRTFFQYGRFREMDFRASELNGVSFKGADLKGSQFREDQIEAVFATYGGQMTDVRINAASGTEFTAEALAYALAVKRIAEAVSKRSSTLHLSGTSKHNPTASGKASGDPRLNALDRLPPSLTQLTNLQNLNLSNTRVADLSRVDALHNLKTLDISHTPVKDIWAISVLSELRTLFLNHTLVEDLTGLALVQVLERVFLAGTPVLGRNDSLRGLIASADQTITGSEARDYLTSLLSRSAIRKFLYRASKYSEHGRYQLAERIYRAIWHHQRKDDVDGPEHPNTLVTRHNLAQQIGNQGRYAEAEEEFRAIWEIKRRDDVLDPEHLSTLSTRHDLAQQISNQGRYAEAEEEFRAILEIQRRDDVLGPEHPHTLVTRHEFARQIGDQGRYAEAEEEFRAILEIQRRDDVLGPEHPHTLTTRHNLAQQIGNQGRYAEAEEEFRAIWEIRRRDDVLGPVHPHVARSEFWIAKMLDSQSMSDDASSWLDGLEQKYLHSLDENHNWVKELRQHLGTRVPTKP